MYQLILMTFTCQAEKLGVKIILPVDFTCSSKFGEDGEIKDGWQTENG